MISGLFDLETRLSHIDKTTDPLVALDAMIDWEQFHPPGQEGSEMPPPLRRFCRLSGPSCRG